MMSEGRSVEETGPLLSFLKDKKSDSVTETNELNPIDKLQIAQMGGVTIEPTTGWTSLQLKELWRYRELLYFLTWRDVKVRYKQTALGAAWAVIQPFMTMVVFSFFFGRLAKMGSDGIPYPIFNYVALLPWTYFSQSLASTSNSLVGSAHLITKVFFPRLVIPISSVLSGLVDFFISFIVLIGMMLYYQIKPSWTALNFSLIFISRPNNCPGGWSLAFSVKREVS